MSLLRTEGLTVRFGGVVANDGIDLTIEEGKVVGLIGPNGAGKTTFIDAITGYVRSTGVIELDGEDIRPLAPNARVHRGLVRTFQSLELFEDLAVEDNVLVAAQKARWYDAIVDMLGRRRVSADVRARVDHSLAVVGLSAERRANPASLSQGQRKLVGVARALAASPRLVLLDEPAAGLDTTESQVLGEQLRGLPEVGLSVLLIDHDMGLVLSVCDYLYVLDFGRVIAEGTPADIRANPRVIQAYLGESAGAAQEEAARGLRHHDGEEVSS
jgi:branched-chain amino acid transport system ATP-binding protein